MLKIVQRGGGLLNKIFPQDKDPYNAKTYQLGAVEITAPRKADANPTVTIVSKDEIEQSGALSAGQALRFTPGVFYMPTSTTSTIYIRGFREGETGFYFDGIPIGEIYTGNANGDTDLTPFVTFGLSEIQISKGYTSPTFSSSKMGGAMNMVSSIPVKEFEMNAKYTFVANNEHRTNLQVGRNFGSDYFQLTFSHIDRKSVNYSYDYSGLGPTEISDSGYRSYMFSGKYGFVFDNHEYSANFYHQHSVRGSFPYYDKTAFYVLGNSRWGFVSLDSKVWYHMNMNQSGTRANWSSLYDDYTIGLTETLRFDFSENQNLKFGIMTKNDNHEARDAVTNNIQRDWSVLNSSVFTEYGLRVNDIFRFVLSASYDRHDGLNVKNGSRSASVRNKVTNKHIWGSTLQGILYANLGSNVLLHANIGHKTNIPKVRELYNDTTGQYAKNSSLTSEALINYEIGADFNYNTEQLGTTSLGATAFYNDYNNMITYYFVDSSLCDTPSSSGCIYYDNVKGGYSYGGEAFVKQGFWGNKFILGANWSYIQRQTRSYNRQTGALSSKREFTTHPRQNINISALIAPRKEYNVNLNGSVQTSRYYYSSQLDDYIKIPTVFFLDVSANYYLKDNLKLSVGAYNLFDKNYNYTAGANAYRGGLPGRRVFTSLEYRY